MPNNFVVDLHCHPNIKSFNSGHPKPTKNIWEKIVHDKADKPFLRFIRKNTIGIHKESQCNFYALAKGNVRVAQVSLYPIEKGFTRLRNLPHFIVGHNATEEMFELISGMSKERVKVIKEQSNHYFHDLNKEYQYMAKGQGPSPCGEYEYKIVNNYSELEEVVNNQPNTIAVILSIEGAHAFGCGNDETEKMSLEDLKTELSKNIKKVKDWEHPPFSVNLAHHMWNQLTGHSTSFKNPINLLLKQGKGLDRGLTELGRHVMRELLSTDNGKRIHIDTKHMSVKARQEYYGFVRNYNFLNPENKIPVICSHTGVNGYKDLETSLRKKDNNKKSKKSILHKWSINISQEEIRIIHESEGIIGIMLDKGMLGGGNHGERISAFDSEEKKRREFTKLIWYNIFHIIKAVDDRSAWDVVGVGTDFDGTITHMDPYDTAEKFPMLQEDLLNYLKKHEYQKELWYDYSPEQLVSKLMNENALAFLKKYFV